MELQAIIEKRQSIRHYLEGGIPDADLEDIIKAAATAPSGKNTQNWHFIAIKNRKVIQRIADAISEKNESICLEMDKVDKEKADRFRKFCKNFTVFWRDTAPAIILTMATVYVPSGYNEYKLIGAEQELLLDLMGYRNPGMQSVGAACENLTLKAIDLGYGTCWLTSANYAAAEIEQILKEEIGFEKDGYFFVNMFAIGLPQANQKSPAKKALEEVYTLVK
ncbi:nitroreductase family protein [Aminipila luticellarii]|uniref:Nitroreductase family protein n=1 Tax=Aminipila luticellarii TaxID=2507160 RepID=A0A410PYB2_9FIRM|nr:nitroreductase family protein [Aminipila luticellarii]QAT43928.1 nitroreductase family protein [Aminipila luticellarii]